ncbi:hypothetical protein SZ47_09770 [Brachyspira hyodysenteriae]|uniref:Beta-carotene 15,15'-monooxygenase n=1 Tax=Brachyspira hyodysenteriae ATCC 27164 TaxID=1266923 RepID=A0A3B6W4I0_BRAHO|nr:hypothetical protein [Brachyspira hyodysenteriae]ANN63463.1 hypothetical protein BHYOB78_06170 [Brachyspira hyodysenteriae ATCC 27164]KLI24522.1 hypothetical protein SZ47_09770 [Brachyspira hyodysenteriae]
MFSLRKELKKKDFETLDLFTISFSLFKANFINFIILSLICCLPLILTGIYFPISVFDPEKLKTIEDLANWFKNDVTVGFYINISLSLFLDTISIISVSLLVERLIYGNIKSATWAIIRSFKFLLPTLFTTFIYFILVFLGLTFFIVPGIAFIVFFVFIKNICALRHTWGINALKYSYYLVKPKFFKTLFILGFIFLFQKVFAMTLFPVSLENREGLLSYFIAMIVLYIFNTYFQIIITLFFLNRDYVSSNMIEDDEDDEYSKDNNDENNNKIEE